jgi:hypothetical protein
MKITDNNGRWSEICEYGLRTSLEKYEIGRAKPAGKQILMTFRDTITNSVYHYCIVTSHASLSEHTNDEFLLRISLLSVITVS